MKKITKKLVFSMIGLGICIHSSAFAADLSGWAVSEYQAANEAGLLSYTVASNNLKASITREEFCELAVNLYKKLTNEDMTVPQAAPFVDTDNESVSKAYYYGLVSGTSDTTFSPDKLVTRQEMAKMLVNTLTAGEAAVALSDGKDDSVVKAFSDGDTVDDWAKPAMVTLLNYSLINGVEGKLLPQGNTTREQAIASVNRSYSTFSQRQAAVLDVPEIVAPPSRATIEGGQFTVAWTPTTDAQSYYLIIKDENSNPVYTTDVVGTTSTVINEHLLKTGKTYSAVVGAQLSNGADVFSVPVDFTYLSAPDKKGDTMLAAQATDPKAQAVLKEAEKYIGVKYVYGGTTPDGFDCSGFVQYVFRNNGITLQRTSRDQFAKNGTSVSKDQMKPGDLIFFGTGGTVNHVGIYAGEGQMIHSPSTGKTVCYTSIESSYYTARYMGTKRVIE